MADVAALAKKMEDIRIILPRFDQCISLLRSEILELKAGKLDHRLREVAATPLVDPVLHSVLSEAVDGGLSLPSAPSFSDSEEEQEDEEPGEEDQEQEQEKDKEEQGDQEEVKKGEERGEKERGQEEDGIGRAGVGAAVGGVGVEKTSESEREGAGDDPMLREAEGGRRQRGGNSDSNGTRCRGSVGGDSPSVGRDSASVGQGPRSVDQNSPSVGPKPPSVGEDPPEGPAKPTARLKQPNKTGERIPSSDDEQRQTKANGSAHCAGATTPRSNTKNNNNSSDKTNSSSSDNNSSSNVKDETEIHNGTPGDSHASPLRDRPPIPSGGGSRLVPPAPPPISTHSTPPDPGGDEDRRDVSTRGDAGMAGGGGGADRSSCSGAGGGVVAAASVTPGPELEKKSETGGSGGSVSGKEDNSGSASKRGRKRPRAGGDSPAEKPDRERTPLSTGEGGKRGEGGSGVEENGVKGDEDVVKRERADSVDAEHFRRIAMEVWDRVYRHKFAIIFRKPVNPKDAPGYEKVIKKPMDLSLIRQRIMSGALLSLDDMSRDLFVMCNNAMVFNGKGDPYFDYSKELRTYANEVIEEARRPGFVTADPGFDSVVAGARTSRARQPEPAPPPRSASRGRGQQKRGGHGGGGSGGRRKSREPESAPVTPDAGSEDGKGGGGSSVDGEKKRASAARKAGRKSVGKRGGGGKGQAAAGSGAESGGAGEGGESSGEGEEEDGGAVGNKGKKRAREGAEDDSDEEEQSVRAKGRKVAKPTAKYTPTSKARTSKKRAR